MANLGGHGQVPANVEALLFAISILLALTAQAATPEAAERSVLDYAARELPSFEGHQLQIAKSTPWAAGTTVRLAQSVNGVQIEGRQIIVQVDSNGAVRRSSGALSEGITIDTVPTLPAKSAEAEAARISGFLGTGALWSPRSELKIWIGRDGIPHLAWGVDVSTAKPMRTWRIMVDAHDGTALNTRPTSFNARGNVFPTNPEESELTEVELPGLTSDTDLSGEYAWVVSCDEWNGGGGGLTGGGSCEATSSHALPDPDGNYLFESDPGSYDDPLAEVQMYYHLDLMSAWYEDTLGFSHTSPMQGIVNFDMDNAFYGDADGDGIAEVAFGQSSTMDFAYDADVIYHEFTHSVIGTVSNLGFFGADEYGITFAPLALNEGSADVFSMFITLDPHLGSYAGNRFGQSAIRELEEDRSCPNNLYGEAHEDGMIWGAMGWNMIDDPAIGPDVSAQLFYGTALGFPYDTDWTDAGDVLAETTGDMLADGAIDQTQHDAILGHLDTAGVQGCKRVIPLDDGFQPELYTQYIGMADLFGHIPLTAQYSLEAPEGATEIRLRVREWTTAFDMGWTVFVRRGEHVKWDLENLMGFDVPVIGEYDFAVDGDGKGTVVVDADSEVPLEAGETYYFALATRNLGGIGGFDMAAGEVVVSGGVECCTDPIEPSSTEEKRACGCASSTTPATAAWLLALAGVLGLRRRRFSCTS